MTRASAPEDRPDAILVYDEVGVGHREAWSTRPRRGRCGQRPECGAGGRSERQENLGVDSGEAVEGGPEHFVGRHDRAERQIDERPAGGREPARQLRAPSG